MIINEKIKTEIPASKSLYNRALIVQSFFSQLELLGNSTCDDVVFAKKALSEFNQGKDIYCGEGGTTFRFICVRVSRQKGSYRIFAKKRLLERPQKGLIGLLTQLNTKVTVFSDHYLLECQGWDVLPEVIVDTSESSQYASALMLSSWNLKQDLKVKLQGTKVSEAYFNLTLEMLRQFGLQFDLQDNQINIPAHQQLTVSSYRVESDVSSAFSVVAFGILSNGVELVNFPYESRQPDLVFLDIISAMGVRWERKENTLIVQPSRSLRPIEWDLFNSPDLFPVLSVLCAFARGDSKLFNAPHLVAKESNRILKTSELLRNAGVLTEVLKDGMIIHGGLEKTNLSFSFDPDSDHRMVMAASCLTLSGAKIDILNKNVVDKSFPEFWQTVGM